MNGHIDCCKLVLDTLAVGFVSSGDAQVNEEQAKTLVRIGINARDKNGLTAPHYAALNGHVALLSILYEHGAGINFSLNSSPNKFN